MTTPVSLASPLDAEILDLLPDALICVDRDARILVWNRAAERLYGHTHDEALGRRAPELLATRLAVPLAEALEACVRTGGWHGTVVNHTAAGHAVTVDERWSACYDESGECVAVIALGREPARDGSAQGLALAGAIAHDVNNVLTVVASYASLVAREFARLHEQTGEERWAALGADIGEIRSAAARGAQLSRELIAAAGPPDPRPQ